MHCFAVAVAFSTAFGFSLAGKFQERDDTSLDIFSDIGWPDLEDSTLSFDDGGIIGDTDPDHFLASGCDVGGDPMLPSKLRARDEGLCLNKGPTSSWFKFPPFFWKKAQPSEPEEAPEPVLNKDGYYDKCPPAYRFNLCCEGEAWGLNSGLIWDRFENCYVGMPLSRSSAEDASSSIIICYWLLM